MIAHPPSVKRAGPLGARARLRPIVAFFALAFTISWACWVPTALASRGLLSFSIAPAAARALGAFGPSVAALIATGFFAGWRGVRALLGRLLIWRVGLGWYVVALLLPAALSLATTGVHVLRGGAAPDFAHPPLLRYYPLPPELATSSPFILLPFVFLQQTLLGSAMGEELGWRGFALPRLQARSNALLASVVIGLLWGLWHLPLYLTRGDALAGTSFAWSLPGIVASAVLFTWIANGTRGSLVPVLLFHGAIATTGLFLSPAAAPPLLEAIVSLLATAVVIVIAGPRYLGRGKSGAAPPPDAPMLRA